MINRYGCQSMVNQIRKVLIKHAKEGFKSQSELNKCASKLNYSETPNFSKSISDYDQFVKLLKSFDIEIHYLPYDNNTTPDSIYTHDPCIVSNRGVILCSMGKNDRCSEVPAIESYFESLDIPILGKIKKPGNLEGGDVVWINERSVAVGEGYRSNSEGIKQLKDLLSDLVDIVISVPLPHWTGPLDCLHLMSLLSPIDKDLFLVYSRLLSVPFLRYLSQSGIKLIHVPDNEYDSMGCNVLAVAPKKVIMLEGNPETRKMLEKNKVEVFCYDGSEISLKGSGGPTCLTRPFLRQ